jgi:hypothetical protein
MNKQCITQAVRDLLTSARNRGTEQGVLVYTRILEMLENADNESDVAGIRHKLCQALDGIEAHGDFTDTEFIIVQNLRGPP